MYLMISPICEECKVCFLVRCKEAKKKKKKKRMGCDSQGITPLSIGPLFLQSHGKPAMLETCKNGAPQS